ncbi:hypothetical protein, conserved [Eimeria maxima]|uniref:Uncharacterized protein n=1 Tax=Eimeria maxima TaxID=5804 RepID=U6M8B6_EIMMA|nr:hypothetical protein, conserved [Eimeria maxima]CDJ60452.1 hypothetical protein, conserved [Eimeria maxima]
MEGIEAEAALELHTVEASAGSPWDVDSLLGLKRVGLSETPSGSSASQAAAVAVGPSSSAGAPSVPSGAPEGPSGTSKETHTSADATSLAEANLRNAQLEAEAQQLRHELLLLKRRMQCEAAAQQAQHEADSAAARAAWESEKQKLLIKNRTLQTTVDQTLARYEEDVRLLGQARGCVLQQQQLEQQQQHEQQQLQLQQALQAERDHWSARLQAANDEWRRRLQDEQRQAEAKLQQQQREPFSLLQEIPAWHELHSLAQESRRHSEEFKRLLQSLQKQQQQQLQQQQLQLQQLHQQLHQQQRAEVAGTEKKCESCGRQAEMEGAVAALQQQQQTLQQQQQALALLAQETAKLRDETEQRTRVASAKLAAESLQLQSLHRSLLESRQQQQMLQQQQQQQLQQQQQFIEQQQHAFAQRQLQAEILCLTISTSMKAQEALKLRSDAEEHEKWLALDQLLRVMFVICGFCCGCRQELTETALALEEKRRELRRCFEDMEVQRLAFESRAAAAAAQAEAAAAEARDAKILQQESLQAKEAVHKLHLQAKDVRMICTRRLTFNPTCRAIGRPHCIK